MIETPLVSRRDLVNATPGPLLIDEYDATIVVPPDFTARLDERDNIVLENRRE